MDKSKVKINQESYSATCTSMSLCLAQVVHVGSISEKIKKDTQSRFGHNWILPRRQFSTSVEVNRPFALEICCSLQIHFVLIFPFFSLKCKITFRKICTPR